MAELWSTTDKPNPMTLVSMMNDLGMRPDTRDERCDLDPLILRARLLHGQGLRPQALSVEEELQPIF